MRVRCAPNNADTIAGKFLSCFQSFLSFDSAIDMQCVLSFCMCWFALELFLLPFFIETFVFPCDLKSHCSWSVDSEQINCENGNSLLFNTIIYSRQLAGPMGAITVTEMHRDTRWKNGINAEHTPVPRCWLWSKAKASSVHFWCGRNCVLDCLFWMLCAICESSHT